jgi:hypothetical protein
MKTILSPGLRLQQAELLCQRLLSESAPPDLIPGTAGSFGEIVKENLEPTVRKAKAQIDQAVNHTSAKIKAWALTHLVEARKLGRRTDLFEKLLNPVGATNQLVGRMLNMPGYGEEAQKAAVEISKIDDVLGSIQL